MPASPPTEVVRPNLQDIKARLAGKLPGVFQLDDEPLAVTNRMYAEEDVLKNRVRNLQRQEAEK